MSDCECQISHRGTKQFPRYKINYCPAHKYGPEAVKLLEKLEWADSDSAHNGKCLLCGGRINLGHNPDCELKSLLEKVNGKA